VFERFVSRDQFYREVSPSSWGPPRDEVDYMIYVGNDGSVLLPVLPCLVASCAMSSVSEIR